MAVSHVTTRSILSAFLLRLSGPAVSSSSRFTTLCSRQLSLPLLPSLAYAIPSAIQLNVPRILDGLWESILRAVPKKKTSHMKKRHRQMAGKALKDVTSLNKCSACGNVKRAHFLCPYCVTGGFQRHVYWLGALADIVAEIKNMFNGKTSKTTSQKPVDQ
jgi:large subunit ribosomal protein L32